MAKEVGSGMYQTASEVIRAGLRKLKADKVTNAPWAPSTIKELEDDLLNGIASLNRGESIKGKEAYRQIRKRMIQARSRG